MGAAESTPGTSPRLPPSSPRSEPPSLPQFQPGRPLHTLLHPTSSPEPLPSDPDHEIWPVFFNDYAAADPVSQTLLTPLAAHVLSKQPSPPHIRSLAMAVRAATFRLRAHCAAAASGSPSPFRPAEVLGALLFARAALRALRSRGASHDQLAEALGSLDGAADMPRADRIDIGHSVLWQLIASALDCLLLREPGSPATPFLQAAVELVFVALSDELYGEGSNVRTRSVDVEGQEERLCTLSAIVDRYSKPEELVCALLDIVADLAGHVRTATLLANGVEAANPSATKISRASAISMAASGVPFPQGGIGVGMAALAATASAFNFQTGFNDALAALSARFPLRGLVNSSAGIVAPQSIRPEMAVPDVDPEPYAHYSMDPTSIAQQPSYQSPPSPNMNDWTSSRPNSMYSDTAVSMTDSANGFSEFDPRSPRSAQSRPGSASFADGSVPGSPVPAANPTTLAELSLALLALLCGPRPSSPFRKALCLLKDSPRKAENTALGYSFSRLYEALGNWIAHPRAALLAYYLITGNRRFRTFTLARTDPDVLLIPLLGSLRKRCIIGGVAADAYIPAAILLMLTSDKGFCEAIDMINVPHSWLTFVEDKARIGSEAISLSGVILLVCARVVQQSLVLRRRMPECYLAGLCLSVMANVSEDVTNLHSLASERLLSLAEFLGRRRKKAVILACHREEMPSIPPRIGDSPRIRGQKGPPIEKIVGEDLYLAGSAKLSDFETSGTFLDQLADFIGMSLEIIAAVLRSRSVVSANRHLVYTLLHREAILDSEHVSKASVKCEALCHVLKQVVSFFGNLIDESTDPAMEGNKRASFDRHSTRSSGISVERVFEVIDKNSRHLRADIFEGLPDVRFSYEEVGMSEDFTRTYSWSLAARSSDFFWDLETAAIPVRKSVFLPSK